MRKTERTQRAQLVATARDHVGYRALPNRDSAYGKLTGHPNQTWNGAFLTVLFEQAGIPCPPFDNTAVALAEYARQNRLYRKPLAGDVVFYAFSADGPYGQPHTGLVTEVDADGTGFRAVEAQVSPPSRRGNQDPTGVFERQRFLTDVLSFARPAYGTTAPTPAASGDGARIQVRTSTVRPGATNQQVEAVQHALGAYAGLQNAERGVFDRATVSAYARWQRLCGLVGDQANGTPDKQTLEMLAERDGRFTVRD